jgi:hypothetical protein
MSDEYCSKDKNKYNKDIISLYEIVWVHNIAPWLMDWAHVPTQQVEDKNVHKVTYI